MYRFSVAVIVAFGLISSLWALWSSPYLPAFHDQYQAERIFEMSRALAYGQLPPRFVQELGYGYGYPLFNFYGPLPYYFGSLFFLLGIDLIVATKLMITIGFCAAFFTMYYCAKRFWGSGGALLSAILYTFAPYHAVQLYVRGAIGEMFAYALLPLVVLGCFEITRPKPSSKILGLSIMGTTLLYLSHTVSLYMTVLLLTPFVLAVITITTLRHKSLFSPNLFKTLAFYLLPILFSAYFWLPAITELSSTRLNLQTGNDVVFSQHFLSVGQLWNSTWGYGGSAPSQEIDGMSFMIGKAAVVLAVCALFLTLIFRKYSKTNYFLMSLMLLTILFTTQASQFLWNTVPMMGLIQFPWRWLLFISLFTTLIAGYLVPAIKTHFANRPQFFRPAFLVIIFALTFQLIYSRDFDVKFFRPATYYMKNAQEAVELQHLQGEVSAVSDEYLYRNIEPPTDIENLVSTLSCTMPCQIYDDFSTPTQTTITLHAAQSGQLNIDKANFPGYRAYLNNSEASIAEYQGMLGVTIPKAGDYTVRFDLQDTPIRLFANMLSLTSLLVTIIVLVVKNKLIARIYPFGYRRS